MKKVLSFLFISFLFTAESVTAQNTPEKTRSISVVPPVEVRYTPDKIYGQLFTDVQAAGIFPDDKTFVDCTPKRKPADIMYDYGMAKGPGFDLKKFISDNFNLPAAPPAINYVSQENDVTVHIQNLWNVLKRDADKPVEGSSLLPLPGSYIVPGGRFREIYYWDSYFTMLGLKESGEVKMIENMIDNFAYLINTYGHIPNGNRTYYLSRSQPPFFSMMVELLAGIKGNSVYKKYLPAMEKEYAYWMEGSAKLKNGTAYKRVVKLADGTILNRYWDDLEIPRQEGYGKDVKVAEDAVNEKMMTVRFANDTAVKNFRNYVEKNIYRNLRTGACSGWDFSSRWFEDANKISTIQIIDIAPVDLNCLLLHLERTILKAKGKTSGQTSLNRTKAIEKYFWNRELNYFTDYNFAKKQQQSNITAAGLFPFNFITYSSNVNIDKGMAAAKLVRNELLKDGGLLTTTNTTGQQWDAPNGWAPLQWMAITGLEKCNQKVLAKEIATRWIKLNNEVYQRTGKLMEKYDVVDTHLEAGGGEYPGQDGFGWTNGVLLALIKKYGLH